MSATFGGGSGYSLAGNPLLGTGSFTVACYNRHTGSGGWQPFVGVDDGASTYCFFGLEQFTAQFRPDSGGTALNSGVNETTNTWYYTALTFNGTTGIAYIALHGGGSLASTSGSFTAASSTGTTTRIGVDGYGAALGGELAYLRVWQAVLSSSELEAERLSTSPVRTTNLVSHYRFDTASTADNFGTNTLTAVGTPGSGTSPALAGFVRPTTIVSRAAVNRAASW